MTSPGSPGLVRIKNNADAAIAELIGRPSASGNIGEFVAARSPASS